MSKSPARHGLPLVGQMVAFPITRTAFVSSHNRRLWYRARLRSSAATLADTFVEMMEDSRTMESGRELADSVRLLGKT